MSDVPYGPNDPDVCPHRAPWEDRCPECEAEEPEEMSAESRKIAEAFYNRHAVTPEELRYLMTVRKLTPELRQQVFALCDTMLLQHSRGPDRMSSQSDTQEAE